MTLLHPRVPLATREGSTPCLLRRTISLSTAVASATLVIIGIPLTAQAAIPTSTTFTFSGALSGTVHMPNGPCTGSGGQFEFDGKSLKGSKARTWTVNVNSPSATGGTWKKFTSGSATMPDVSVVLQGRASSKEFDWITMSGKITTSKTSGNINVTLGPDHSFSGVPGSGTIHLTGSWGCASA